MKMTACRTRASAAAIVMATLMAAPAIAQDKPEVADAGSLDAIVVTASVGNKTKLNSSISVTSVSSDTIADFRPQSTGDLLRLLPGLQPNISGPGGNGNFAVRGLPVATGGATFVQLQEDGLPLVLYGDMQFGNNDYFTRFDALTETVDAVRGGTTATLASQAPGAVINYISKTSRSEGGFVELEKGVSYDWTRVNFRQSGSINDSTYYNIGGFYNVGRGPKGADYNVSNSYQIRGNVTKELADNKGYVRLLFKVADTQEPNDTGGIACATVTGPGGWGSKVSGIQPCANFDTRKQSIYSINNASFYYVDVDGTRKLQPLNGITTKQKTFQGQIHYEFSDNLRLDYNARFSNISGGFASGFFGAQPTSSVIGTKPNEALPNAAVATIRYANGPSAGALYTNPLINTNTNVYTRIRDVGGFVNDLKLTGTYEVSDGIKANLTAGWFFMSQKIAMDWHTQKTFNEVSGTSPAMLNLYDSAGALLTANGIAGYGNNWGGCCARTYDYTFTDNAPYLSLNLDGGAWQLDASVRQDYNRGSGSGQNSTGKVYSLPVTQIDPFTKNSVTTNIAYYLPDAAPEVIKYSKNLTAWSFGGLYKPADNTSLFIRASRGTRFNADRMTFNGYFTPSGALNSTSGAAAVSDIVNQYEIGLKNGGNLAGGRYTAELTLYKSNFNITTYELSQTKCGGVATGCIVANKYKTTGAEFYGTYRNGGFTLLTNLTYNKAKKQPSGANAYVRSDGIPDLSYTVAVNYDVTDTISFGGNMTGVTTTVDNDGLEYPGGTLFGINAKFSPIKNLQFGVNVANLFNTLTAFGPTGIASRSGNSAVLNLTSAVGRTVTGSARFSF